MQMYKIFSFFITRIGKTDCCYFADNKKVLFIILRVLKKNTGCQGKYCYKDKRSEYISSFTLDMHMINF